MRNVMEHSIAASALPLLLTGVLVGAIYLLGVAVGFPVKVQLYSPSFLIGGPPLLLLIMVCAFLRVLYRDRPSRPTKHLLEKLRHWKAGERILRGLPILLVYPLFFGAFTSYKATIGKIVPFHFDQEAKAIDSWLHGGDAWLLFDWLLGYPAVTVVMDIFYFSWFFTLYFMLGFAAFMVTDMRLRAQYLLSFLLSWVVIGMIAATVFASVGPCYYLHFNGDDSYEYIFDYLKLVNEQYGLRVLDTQRVLVANYAKDSPGLGAGISAVPSMHVAIAALNAILLSRFGSIAGAAGWGFCLIIFLGSVHLGWHYAIDGYIAIALTVLIWWIVGRFVGSDLHKRLIERVP